MSESNRPSVELLKPGKSRFKVSKGGNIGWKVLG